MSEPEPVYTVEEARALLPVVRGVLLQLAFARRRDDEADRGAVVALFEHLESLGVVLRDVDSGLVDFPTLRDGERAWLCWRLADPELAYWHTTREGFASRRPL
jgi:hypothetical protein